ncbi:MAG: right-handed parallel beta-helix repeat-containing protein [Actinomycetota bacterium]|nr:right-handed parallel beta-helix repeat-containing protein [Actinomycetota bacterium]
MGRRFRGVTRGALTVMVLAAGLAFSATASAHEERESQFPPGTGEVPTYRTHEQAAAEIVVCKPDSADRIATITDATLRAFNEHLLTECAHEHLQAAVDAVTVQGTNIYVLPGHYREEPSWAPPCTEDYDGGVVTYEQTVSCGEIVNLVTIAGDDPTDPDMACDNALCNLQIEGTGAEPTDVVFTSGFKDDGDWVKHNVLKADRADGFYLRNATFELARENAVYIHETDGYAIDRVVARYNDLYGILTFTSDHGLIRDCVAHHNGDSGVYPGSAADVNAESTERPPLTRWAVEITGCDTHHNALGFSGTAGNSVYFHDNDVHHNAAGYVTDSFVGGHPGMPQDHAWLEGNRIYANNVNFYENVQGTDAPCQAEHPADVGYEDGVVCPAFGVPVGTGVLFAGGNYNLVNDNEIYDNWRSGVMLFWVPGIIRGDTEVLAQLDTSNYNRVADNRFGFHPAGVVQPNGVDLWWDDQGIGNCWEGNVAASGTVSFDALLPLPDCAIGSLLPAGNAVKSLQLLPCGEYNRTSNPAPPNCDWFTTPSMPAGRQAAPDEDAAAAGGGTTGPDPSVAGSQDDVPTSQLEHLPKTGAGQRTGLAVVAAAVALAVLTASRRARTR